MVVIQSTSSIVTTQILLCLAPMVFTYTGNHPLQPGSPAVDITPPGSAAAADILLLTPSDSQTSLIQYRMLGGTLDFYFFSGPTPSQVIEQYSQVVGKPAWQNAWAFGYQQCRWGYEDVSELREIVRRMNDSKIPLEGRLFFFYHHFGRIFLRLQSYME